MFATRGLINTARTWVGGTLLTFFMVYDLLSRGVRVNGTAYAFHHVYARRVCFSSAKSPDEVLLHVSVVLQDKFPTGIGYIDED